MSHVAGLWIWSACSERLRLFVSKSKKNSAVVKAAFPTFRNNCIDSKAPRYAFSACLNMFEHVEMGMS